jgi:uncharacterized protein with FMN-binding domain
MKKIFVSIFIIGSFSIYALLHNKTSEISAVPVRETPSSTVNTSSSLTVYKDGEYTGPVVDAYYGNIQVKAIIENGKLSDIQFLQYPNGHHESVEINTNAMPILKQEAIAAQTAQVDGVTRATDSSIAFRESLGSALAQARK